MLPPVGVEPRASDFYALHATVWAYSIFAGFSDFLILI